MAVSPSDAVSETIPGDPTHASPEDADSEFEKIAGRGGGQPYLMAIMLKDEPRTLHLRAYLDGPSKEFEWANLTLTPKEVQSLAAQTSQSSALAWSSFKSGGIAASPLIGELISRLAESEDLTAVLNGVDAETSRALVEYLMMPGDGLFFDPARNHDAWSRAAPLPMAVAEHVKDLIKALEARFPSVPQGDAAAEKLLTDPNEIEEFRQQIAKGSYAVADATATLKTRGSAQRAFADAVKTNYGYCCAIAGITTKDFLVASHIVPWSTDQDIRLDPSNGICLSLLVDRAFEKGYLTIDDDLTIRIDDGRIGKDDELRKLLQPFHGKSLSTPAKQPPRAEYLQRRRASVASSHVLPTPSDPQPLDPKP